MKQRHNKKRNTAFLYEVLIKEYTIHILQNNIKMQKEILNIIQEFFTKGRPLSKDLKIYNTLLETKGTTVSFAARLLHEVRKDFLNLNRQLIFDEQTKLLKKINESLSNYVFATFLSNYRDIATIGQFLNLKGLGAKQRIIMENKVISLLSSSEDETPNVQHIDNLTYKTFVDKFNNSYKNLLREEQKSLLTHYITSFSDNGLGLKAFLNEEIGRLKVEIDTHLKDDKYSPEFGAVLNKLNNYSKVPISDKIIKEVFYIQDLLVEVKKNGR